MKSSGTLAALLESFFIQRLINQRQASPDTISSYRDTFRLLLQFAQQRLHKASAKLAFEENNACWLYRGSVIRASWLTS